MVLEGEGRLPIQIYSGNEGDEVLLTCLVRQTGCLAGSPGKTARQTGSLAGRPGNGRLSRQGAPGKNRSLPVLAWPLARLLPAVPVPRPVDRTLDRLVRSLTRQTGYFVQKLRWQVRNG